MNRDEYADEAKKVAFNIWTWGNAHTTVSVGAICLVLGRLGFPWIV